MMGKTTTIGKMKHVREGWQLFRNRKTLACMIRETWRGHYSLSLWTRVSIIAGLVYVVMPFDFDWIPILGWLDDGFVLFLVIRRLQNEAGRFVRYKAMERRRHDH